MSIFEAIIMGFLQGLTEFLPVSSSGHLVIAQHFFGINSSDLLFSVVVHVATLCSTLVILKDKVIAILSAIKHIKTKQKDAQTSQNVQTLYWIIITTLVTGALAFFFKDFFQAQFESVQTVAYCLIATGVLLFLPTWLKPEENLHMHELGKTKAILMGIAQTFAILPGISRSGTTIVTGLFLKLNRKDAGEFAFLISIPIILIALGMEVLSLEPSMHIPWLQLIAGFVAAFISGLFALKFLLKWVQAGELYYFSFYCWLVAAAILIF